MACLVRPELKFLSQANQQSCKCCPSQGSLYSRAPNINKQQTVEQLMFINGLTEEEAKAEYNAYLENPNNYALAKVSKFNLVGCKVFNLRCHNVLDHLFYSLIPQGEAYYQKLGYKSLMEGVIGEAEKEGRGDEVRERIEAFKRKSQLKAYSVIGTAIIVLFAYKISYDIDPTLFM